METKELKVQVPEGYEIDREKSTFDCIKFKPIKKDITYEDVCNKLFKYSYYFTNEHGEIDKYCGTNRSDPNNAINEEQLEKILALNQLLNIAEYYNRLHTKIDKRYNISYDLRFKGYKVSVESIWWKTGLTGIEVLFNRVEDAQEVIDNPNFREILDTVYKL